MKTYDLLEKADWLSWKPFKSERAFSDRVRKVIVKNGFTPIKGKKDRGGNCLICGESGRCLGWHTEADRL